MTKEVFDTALWLLEIIFGVRTQDIALALVVGTCNMKDSVDMFYCNRKIVRK